VVRFTLHTCPDVESQPNQFPNVEPLLGVAVSWTGVPVVKAVVLQVGAVDAQARPTGELAMVPEPMPLKFTVSVGLDPVPPAAKQTTFAVMDPVTIAPEEDILPALLFVVTVAETRVLPQAKPVTVIRPVELTVTMFGVLEVHWTLLVISFVTGG